MKHTLIIIIKEAQSEIRLSVKPPGNFSFNPYDWSAWKKSVEFFIKPLIKGKWTCFVFIYYYIDDNAEGLLCLQNYIKC